MPAVVCALLLPPLPSDSPQHSSPRSFVCIRPPPRQVERPDDAPTKAHFASNSNLLKVSDWLTTIIVGLSLVSLGAIPGGVKAYSDALRPVLGDKSYSGPFGVFLTVLGFLGGLFAYLWTMIALRRHLERAETDNDRADSLAIAAITGKPREELHEEISRSGAGVLQRLAGDDRMPTVLKDLAREETEKRSTS